VSQILAPETKAPGLNLHVTPDQMLSLDELKGRPVILAFYPADWSPVCGDQLALYNELLPEFRKHNAELVGISVDGVWCHEAYAQARHLHFPLLADFHPKGQVARSYGAYREEDGVCERALFVIDRNGVIAWSYRSPIAVNPGADGILEALESLAERSASHVTA
jgi:peroxiredoxin